MLLVPKVEEIRGLVEFDLLDIGGGIVGSVGLWEDRESVDEFERIAEEYRKTLDYPLEPLDRLRGEVRHRASARKVAA